MKILLVDDDQDFLKLAKNVLEGKGNFEIVKSNLAEEAMDKFEKGHFDAIVSDYRMPGTNGIEFLEEVRGGGSDIPFIIITGKGDEDVAGKALNKGADQYIQKFEEGNESLLSNLAERLSEIINDKHSSEKHDFLQSHFDRNIENRINIAYRQLSSLEESIPKEDKDDFENSLNILEEVKEMMEEKIEFRNQDDEDKVQNKFLETLERSIGFSYYSESNLESNLWDIYKDKGEGKQKFMEIANITSESKELVEDLKEKLEGLDIEESSERAKIRMSSFGTNSSEEIFEKLWNQESIKLELYKELKSSTELELLNKLWAGENPDVFYSILGDLIKYIEKRIKIFEDINENLFSQNVSRPKSASNKVIHQPND